MWVLCLYIAQGTVRCPCRPKLEKRDRVVMIPIHNNIKLYTICHLVQWIVFSREKKRPENIKFIFSFVAQYSLLTYSDKKKIDMSTQNM